MNPKTERRTPKAEHPATGHCAEPSGGPGGGFPCPPGLWASCLLLLGVAWLASPPGASGASPAGVRPPNSPREFYNDGTQQLREGRLREAETSLQAAAASNDERVQPAALYNLGLVRFGQGVQIYTNAPDGGAARLRGQAAMGVADRSIQAARAALEGEDLDGMVRAYMNGRGARKELKSATDAVKEAMTRYGAVLSRWRRSSGDFQGAVELRPALTDARTNAENVDRWIAKLVDQQEPMAQATQAMGEKRKELTELMKKLKGRIPDGMLPKAPGDEDEDDDDGNPKQPQGPEAGQQDRETREGREMALTPEEAMRLLESLQLDANRKLPMGDQESARPRNVLKLDW